MLGFTRATRVNTEGRNRAIWRKSLKITKVLIKD
eukprot:UN02502